MIYKILSAMRKTWSNKQCLKYSRTINSRFSPHLLSMEHKYSKT